jgi:PPK2 family polyphosphate:nucleotide phosphotransferase
MKFDLDTIRIHPGQNPYLIKRPTAVDPVYRSRKEYREMLDEHVKQLSKLQNILYADNRYSVLLIFQAMDAAGKDSVIRHVMSGINPQGCQVYSFKHPSPTELEHDFLWRTNCSLPERGRIGIFNRSYYEEVLIVRVHPNILEMQNIPNELTHHEKVWDHRYRSILDHERHLHCNGTRIVKFYLHLSKEEQRKRFLERIDNPAKNWKFSVADLEERQCWDQYMDAYEICLRETSTVDAPWYAVPADDKKNARLIVSRIVLDTLESLNLRYPETSGERHKELLDIRQRLENPENGK